MRCLLASCSLASALLLPAASAAAARPNIVFMLSDDQGWNGLSTPMHPDAAGSKGADFHTPNLENLASQGMRFSAAYAPAPVCSPTRISLQTGKTPARLHWTKAAPPETGRRLTEPRNVKDLDAAETTVAEMLQGAGYATAHYGKWHIGGGGPGAHGFDEHDGDTGNEHAFQFQDPNPVDLFGMAERSARFMEASSKSGTPFFIQLSWNALHAPENALKATHAKYRAKMPGENPKRVAVAAMTEDLDSAVGRVLHSIDRLGLAADTYVVYMSDNGAGGGRKVLRGGKGGLWEGGVRVPLIVRGPGVAANSWRRTPVVGWDLLPTFAEWAGVPAGRLPKDLDGGSLAPLLKREDAAVKRPQEGLLFHFPHYQGDEGPQSALLLGDYKLIRFYEGDRVALFDLSRDLGEERDLAAERPAEVARLRKLLEQRLSAVDAQFATPNPDFDPNVPSPPRKPGGRGKSGKPPKN